MVISMNDGARPERWQTLAAKFLKKIWSVHDQGYVFTATREHASGQWNDIPFAINDDLEKSLSQHFRQYPRQEYDHYFCPNAFSSKQRRATNACMTRWCQVDIDEADVLAFDPQPNILIRTSPNRHQGLWLSSQLLPPKIAEQYSKELAYRYGADKTGWSTTKVLRVPHTINHKPQYQRPRVRLLTCNLKPQARSLFLHDHPEDLATVIELQHRKVQTFHDWRAVLQRYRKNLHPRVRALIRSKSAHAFERDRSKCIYEIIADLYRVGADFDEIASVLLANPYFVSKHGENTKKAEAEITRIISKLGGAS